MKSVFAIRTHPRDCAIDKTGAMTVLGGLSAEDPVIVPSDPTGPHVMDRAR